MKLKSFEVLFDRIMEMKDKEMKEGNIPLGVIFGNIEKSVLKDYADNFGMPHPDEYKD